MASLEEVLKMLKAKSRPDQLEGMAGYGMTVEKRLGVAIPEVRKMAKEMGKDHRLALDLFKTGILDAMILAAMVDIPEEVTGEQMEEWVKEFNSWDVCDQVCMNLFAKTALAREKVWYWYRREEEFVKRCAFTLIACLARSDKEAPDQEFIKFLPLIKEGATDERNMVKKAVSWALRNIGKRNSNLNRIAVEAAKELKKRDSKSSRWIASDTIRDLSNKKRGSGLHS